MGSGPKQFCMIFHNKSEMIFSQLITVWRWLSLFDAVSKSMIYFIYLKIQIFIITSTIPLPSDWKHLFLSSTISNKSVWVKLVTLCYNFYRLLHKMQVFKVKDFCTSGKFLDGMRSSRNIMCFLLHFSGLFDRTVNNVL